LAIASVCWFNSRGYILYYGDAQAHLNISRGLVDSQTPQFDRIGTVWLPLLHVICVPLVQKMSLWSNGLAASIPVAVCFVVAGCCFYLAAKEAYASKPAAAVVVACFALNPNILYLASIPMTEVVFFAGLGLLLLTLLRYRRTQSSFYLALGVISSWAMSLTRYDGWFLIPFEAIWFVFFSEMRRRLVLVGFLVLACAVPVWWLAHCWWETGNALDFYNGPYSAQAIQDGKPYPGYHDWGTATRFYSAAGELCSGWGLILLGVGGAGCAIAKRVFSPIGLLCLLPIFYIWSVHSSGLPIHIPELYWPNSYYNTRYGTAVTVLAAFASGAITLALPPGKRKAALALPLIAVLPWLLHPDNENWICWKESEVNSVSRRAWTEQAASFLERARSDGQQILTSSGDVLGIYCRARIPLRETLHLANGPAWEANSVRPDLAHQSEWAVALAGDPLSVALHRARHAYQLAMAIQVNGAPALEIYERHLATPQVYEDH
jgi:hypothetical protein